MNFHAVIWVSFLSLFLQEKKEEKMEEIYYIPLIFFKAYLILPAMRMVLCLFLY